MEFNSEFLMVQGVLNNIVRTSGPLNKLRFKGGNETKIELIIKELNYLKPRTLNKKNDKDLEDITYFLMINSEFEDKDVLNSKEIEHLINIIPTLSQYLLANIIVSLNLVQYYCTVLQKLPVKLHPEVLYEVVYFLRNNPVIKNVEYTGMILKAIQKQLYSLDANAQFNEIEEQLIDLAKQLQSNLLKFNFTLSESKKGKSVGFSILHILEILSCCDVDNKSLDKFHCSLIETCQSLLDDVTVLIYCSWTEVDYKGEHLQIAVGYEAYLAIETLLKYKPANVLTQKLSSISRKPPTTKERIKTADEKNIIEHINEANSEQRIWFEALLTTDIFNNLESIKCIQEWAHLCSSENVQYLLDKAITNRDDNIKKLIIHCVSYLNIYDLEIILTRFFREHGINSHFQVNDVQDDITIMLNKEDICKVDDIFIKKVYMLLLQNPEVTLKNLYIACLKNSVYVSFFEHLFSNITYCVSTDGLAYSVFCNVFENYKPTVQNISVYKKYLNLLLESKHVDANVVTQEVLLPLTKQSLKNEEYESLLSNLQLLNVSTNRPINPLLSLNTVLLNILKEIRFKFFTYSNLKYEITSECVEILINHTENNSSDLDLEDQQLEFNTIDKFYTLKQDSTNKKEFLMYVCPNIDINNYTQTVCTLVTLLPRCINSEWISVVLHLQSSCENRKIISLLADTLTLLCQVAQTQVNYAGLKFCIQQYSIVMKDILLPSLKSDEAMFLVEHVCKLLRDFPEIIRQEEGLRLVGILPDETLTNVKNNKTVVGGIMCIQDPIIAQAIAQRML